jgi:rhodanese-related sulfurtransferase
VQFIIDNILLIAVAFVSGGMLVWPLLRNRAGGPSLTTLQATQLMNGKPAQVIDLRSAEDYAKGSLPNARNIPFEALSGRINELKKDKTVLLVCGNGLSAGKAAAQLRAAGFAEVFTLHGGLAAWREAGLPLGAARAGGRA